MAEGKPLLEKVMEDGKSLRPHPQLQMLQETFKENFAALNERYKSIKDHKDYPVKLSTRLQNLQKGNI